MASLASLIGGAVVGTPAEGVPQPMDLYNRAAPDMMRALGQYEEAAPLIDFATKYWWLLAIGGFAMGVAASYTANWLWEQRKQAVASRRVARV